MAWSAPHNTGASLSTLRSLPADLLPALVPLSLLEAIRNLDTPIEDGLGELQPEHASKRLGLSSTVAAQISRYTDQAERGERLPRSEVASVLRLVGRRADAPLVFANAGRRMARRAVGSDSAPARPPRNGMSRRLAERKTRTLGGETFGVAIEFPERLPVAEADDPVTMEAWPDGSACELFAAGLAELTRLVLGLEGVVRHAACRARGDATCRWQFIPGADEESGDQ